MKKMWAKVKRGVKNVVKEIKDGIKYILNLGDKELKMKIASDIVIGIAIAGTLVALDLRSASVAA